MLSFIFSATRRVSMTLVGAVLGFLKYLGWAVCHLGLFKGLTAAIKWFFWALGEVGKGLLWILFRIEM